MSILISPGFTRRNTPSWFIESRIPKAVKSPLSYKIDLEEYQRIRQDMLHHNEYMIKRFYDEKQVLDEDCLKYPTEKYWNKMDDKETQFVFDKDTFKDTSCSSNREECKTQSSRSKPEDVFAFWNL